MRATKQTQSRSSGLILKGIIAGVLVLAGVVLGASGKATISEPPACDSAVEVVDE